MSNHRRGSESSLPNNLWGQSMDSSATEELEELERRGGAAAMATPPPERRGSRLLEYLEKKNKKKKYKDKQGFVWRRMVHDNEDFLPAPRAPSLGQGACPWLVPKDSIAPAAPPPFALLTKSELPPLPQSDYSSINDCSSDQANLVSSSMAAKASYPMTSGASSASSPFSVPGQEPM